MPVFIPCPPTGLWMCAASPSRKARPAAEVLRHAMVHVVGGEPVDLLHREPEVLDRTLADVLESEARCALGALIAHRADQPCPARAGEREHAEEIRLVQVDVQLAVDRRARRRRCRRRRRSAGRCRRGSRCRALSRTIERAPSQPAR